jgi:uncharacterized protein (TIGR01777 family)
MHQLKNQTVLVTGGTGFVGQALCQSLVEQGAQLFILTRSVKNGGMNTTYITSLVDLKDNVPDIVINLAGEPIAQRWTARAKERIRSSRINMTSQLIDWMRSSKQKPSIFISASAIGYYGTDQTKVFDETTEPVTATAPFAQTLCAEWESIAAQAQGYGVRTVLLRIGAVLGKEGGMLAKLLPSFRLGLGGRIGHGRQWLSWIDRDDLVHLVLHLIHTPTISGPVNATSPNTVTNSEFSKQLAKTLKRPCLFPVPPLVLRLAFDAMADEIMLQGQHVLPQKALASGFVFRYPTLEQSLNKILK